MIVGCAAGMTHDDDPGPTRSVRMLAPLPKRPAVPKDKVVSRAPTAQKISEERKACISASGEKFGPYLMLGEVGKGGMAEVRLAIEELPTGGLRLCVLKRPRRGEDHAESLAALRDEAKLLEKLRHPSIVELYRASELDGQFHLAFELVDGVSLRQLLTMGAPEALPAGAAVEIGLAVSRALAYAHAAPFFVVHRDVTPQNVLVARGGAVKLVDFGIARYADRVSRTRRGTFKGKLGYIAPEQLEGRSENISDKTDVYMLGLVLTELITGERVLPPKLMIAADADATIREQCARANVDAPLVLIELFASMARSNPNDRPEMIEVASRLFALLPKLPPSLSLAELVHRRALAKLLPLDLEAIFDRPTRPVRTLEGDEDAYSGTIELLTAARLA